MSSSFTIDKFVYIADNILLWNEFKRLVCLRPMGFKKPVDFQQFINKIATVDPQFGGITLVAALALIASIIERQQDWVEFAKKLPIVSSSDDDVGDDDGYREDETVEAEAKPIKPRVQAYTWGDEEEVEEKPKAGRNVVAPLAEINNQEVKKVVGKQLDAFSFEDVEEAQTNFPALALITFGRLCERVPMDVLARQVVNFAKSCGKTTAVRGGTIIKDGELLVLVQNKLITLFQKDMHKELLNAALEYTLNVQRVKAAYMTYDQFSRSNLSIVGKDEVVVNSSSQGNLRLCAKSFPAIIFKSASEEVNYIFEEQVGSVAKDVALVAGISGCRSPLTLDFNSKGKLVRRTWVMDDEFLPFFSGKTADLGRSVTQISSDLAQKGYTCVYGNVGASRVSIFTFAIEATKSWAAGSNIPGLLKCWRDIRLGTVLDDAWFKHDYLTIKRSNVKDGPEFVPYNSTALKFIKAYLPHLEIIKGMIADDARLLFLYGGVTSNGKNSQLVAVRYLLEKILGPECVDDAGTATDGKWRLLTLDLNGNVGTGTRAVDASKEDSVMTLSSVCDKFENVVAHLDLADDTVTEALNSSVALFIANFLRLPNVRFVTAKYCATGPIAVRGAFKLLPMYDDEVNRTPVGRSHGVEGICIARPSRDPKKLVSFHPFETESVTEDPHLRAKFVARLQEGNLARFSPRSYYDATTYGDVLTPYFGNASSVRVETTQISQSVLQSFKTENLFEDEDVEDDNEDDRRLEQINVDVKCRLDEIARRIGGLDGNEATDAMVKYVAIMVHATMQRLPYKKDSVHNDTFGLNASQLAAFQKGRKIPCPSKPK